MLMDHEFLSKDGRVELLGAVPHIAVRDVLIRGDIFLNCSLTESFCIAILEAACCGLYVVATDVGGVPEVLSDEMCSLCALDPVDIEEKLEMAIREKVGSIDMETKNEWYRFLRNAYSWQSVAERTEKVYYRAMEQKKDLRILNRMKKYYDIGPLLGKVCAVIVLIDWLLLAFWEWVYPKESIERAIEFNVNAVDQKSKEQIILSNPQL